MKFRNKKVIDMPLDKMNAMVDSFSKVSESKVLSDGEEKEIKSQILSFGHCLSKCGNGHLIPVELRDTMKTIEKCDYNINNFPVDLKTSLTVTYDNLKNCLDKHTGEFKNTQAKLYCNIYEFFTNAKNINFLSKLRKDPAMKNVNISKEDFNENEGITIESIESWLADNTNDRSYEAFGFILGIKAAFTSLSSAIGRLLLSIHSLITILIVLLIVAIILMITLLIINMQYKTELADILKLLAEDKINASGEESGYMAAKNMVEHTNPLVKTMFYKPVSASFNAYNKITEKGDDWLNKSLTAIKNNKTKSKEDLEQSGEAIPVIGVVAGFISSAAIPFWIIFSIICIFIFIKPAVYFIYRLRLKIFTFFKEEADMLNFNIGELKSRAEACTNPIEKERLSKIIKKQDKIYKNLSAIAEWFYKAQQDAAVDARDDVRECDSIDYDKIADENGINEENPEQYDSSIDPVEQTNPSNGPQKPIVIF